MREAVALPGHTVLNKKQDAALVEKYLLEGSLADGENALLAHLKVHADDDQARFGLGVLQFLRGVERLSQDFYRYGLRDVSTHGLQIPFFRLAVPRNPRAETVSYRQVQKIAHNFLANMGRTEATLAKISDPNVTLPVHFGMIRLDLNGDGRADKCETLWRVYSKLSGNSHISNEESKQFYIKFDRGDVHWLRGYCHLLSGICEMYLAHDSRETFDRTAHIFFTRVDSPYKLLSTGKHVHGSDYPYLLDLIALIHTIRWPVVEPQRMEAALHHFEAVAVQSKETWKWILAEKDDDHEWLPNPKQTGVIPNVRVTEQMVSAWGTIMSEIEKLLAGELLIPFWRGDDGLGINLRKVFMEPQTLDLVLWVQGSAANPYLQRGVLTKGATWREKMDAFGGSFPGYAVWFN